MSFEAPTDASFSFGFVCCPRTYSFSKGEGPASAIPWYVSWEKPWHPSPEVGNFGYKRSKLWGKWTLTSFEDVQIMFVPLFNSRWRSFQEWGADMFWWIEGGGLSLDSVIQITSCAICGIHKVGPKFRIFNPRKKLWKTVPHVTNTNYDFSWLPTLTPKMNM